MKGRPGGPGPLSLQQEGRLTLWRSLERVRPAGPAQLAGRAFACTSATQGARPAAGTRPAYGWGSAVSETRASACLVGLSIQARSADTNWRRKRWPGWPASIAKG